MLYLRTVDLLLFFKKKQPNQSFIFSLFPFKTCWANAFDRCKLGLKILSSLVVPFCTFPFISCFPSCLWSDDIFSVFPLTYSWVDIYPGTVILGSFKKYFAHLWCHFHLGACFTRRWHFQFTFKMPGYRSLIGQRDLGSHTQHTFKKVSTWRKQLINFGNKG